MKILLVLFILLFILTSGINGTTEINFFPKALAKDVSGTRKIVASELNELKMKATTLESGKFFQLNVETEYPFVYVGRVTCCRAGGCDLKKGSFNLQQSEYFDYYILFNKNGDVAKVKVFDYRATHGQEISVAGWLKQFVGYAGNESLQVGKNIDAISGATISTNAIAFDVEAKTRLIKMHLAESNLQTLN